MTDGNRIFLVDTGAEISVFKQNLLKKDVDVLCESKIKITGVGNGAIETNGIVESDVIFGNVYIPHDFHIVPATFPIPCAGIIGLDLKKNTNVILILNKIF